MSQTGDGSRGLRFFSLLLSVSLALCSLAYFFLTWHWPLVGDASLMHYNVFLIERVWAPYRDFTDMDMPGTYLVEQAAMHLFGPDALGWRLFDFALVLSAAVAFKVVMPVRNALYSPSLPGSSSWLSAFFAASLFLLVHGRDGLAQGGQRDLTMAVCLIAATAFLFVAVRRDWPWASAVFGLLSGVTLMIKPTTLPLTAAQLLLAALAVHSAASRRKKKIWSRYVLPAALGYLVAPIFALVFLLREHALPAFIAGFHGIIPYYASLGHRPVGYLILHSVSPLLALVIIWLAVVALRSNRLSWKRDWERNALFAGVIFGLVSCVVQARALPYHRYPLLAFLLPLMGIDCAAAIQAVWANVQAKAAGFLALVCLAVGGLFLAPQSAILIHRIRWGQTDAITSLERALIDLGGPKLSHHIQCIDSVSGCGNVLYNLRLEPSNGVLLDFLLFGPEDVPIVRQTRERFLASALANPPQVMVVTSHLFMDGPDNYRKLDRWPAFRGLLADNYTLQTEWTPTRTERWWSREEFPVGYRIYVLRVAHP